MFTGILHRGLPSHMLLTITSESGDVQFVVWIFSWGHTFSSNVLPNIAFSIKMLPLGQVKFIVLPSHVLSFPLKKYEEFINFTKFKENKIKRNENG